MCYILHAKPPNLHSPRSLLYVLYVLYLTRQAAEPPLSPRYTRPSERAMRMLERQSAYDRLTAGASVLVQKHDVPRTSQRASDAPVVSQDVPQLQLAAAAAEAPARAGGGAGLQQLAWRAPASPGGAAASGRCEPADGGRGLPGYSSCATRVVYVLQGRFGTC